jgi:hypothetical protein
MIFDDDESYDISPLKGLIAGVAAGLFASFLMEQFQAGWSAIAAALRSEKKTSRGGRSEPATVKAANVISKKISGRKLPKQYREVAGEVVHYGVGAGSAAVYGLLAEVAPIVTVGEGLAFGTGVWLLADEVAVPAAGLSKGPREIPVTTHIYALASHLVYGWLTEIVRDAVRRAL